MLALCLWTTVNAKANAVEMLMVPSAAMGRDIPAASQGGGPHAGCAQQEFLDDLG
ncbi:hypothetical protein MHPYR_90006 [uncultured Mycobacterium sp.]|uniref:Uncharacterized protein n=1 Tax=uncultured Mycobacterium sp. TaxID=171292 RepID=A0A1Y5PLQ0_9MYCO|nr:hypothetical protein MHPYR_90006 [uncultured Mycobacterium sp.]